MGKTHLRLQLSNIALKYQLNLQQCRTQRYLLKILLITHKIICRFQDFRLPQRSLHFLDVTRRIMVDAYQRFERVYQFSLQGTSSPTEFFSAA
jgi:hypothetical protein